MLHAEKIEVASARTPDLPLLVADSDYIFERLWLRLALNTPGSVLTINGRPVLAHLPDHTSLEGVRAAMTEKRGPENTAGLTVIPMDEGMTIANEERSEEHTSELQSLMRISYAVFCLKKIR